MPCPGNCLSTFDWKTRGRHFGEAPKYRGERKTRKIMQEAEDKKEEEVRGKRGKMKNEGKKEKKGG